MSERATLSKEDKAGRFRDQSGKFLAPDEATKVKVALAMFMRSKVRDCSTHWFAKERAGSNDTVSVQLLVSSMMVLVQQSMQDCSTTELSFGSTGVHRVGYFCHTPLLCKRLRYLPTVSQSRALSPFVFLVLLGQC